MTMKTICPLEISAKISEFCSTISSSKPLYIPVIPEDYSVAGNCYYNVMKKVSYDGGSMQYGWAIWEWPDVMLEGEFHAVWISPQGNLIDITPNIENKILLLPDNSISYDFNLRKKIPNKRKIITSNSTLKHIIELIGKREICEIDGNRVEIRKIDKQLIELKTQLEK